MPYGASPSFRHSSPYRCTPPGPSSTRTELHQTERRQIHRGSIPIASESAVIIEPLGCRPEKAPTDPTARDRTREGIRGPDYKGAAAARASGARNTRRPQRDRHVLGDRRGEAISYKPGGRGEAISYKPTRSRRGSQREEATEGPPRLGDKRGEAISYKPRGEERQSPTSPPESSPSKCGRRSTMPCLTEKKCKGRSSGEEGRTSYKPHVTHRVNERRSTRPCLTEEKCMGRSRGEEGGKPPTSHTFGRKGEEGRPPTSQAHNKLVKHP